MRNKYLKQLYARRTELESKLELYIARYCFGDGEVEDGTEADLKERIREISDEIAVLEQGHNS
ncbi:hypothetical protein MOV66_20315 [Agrobacterium sp. SHOUNA12C]|nr:MULTISPECIES: hypothetical protein [Rhizobium]KAA6482903.1 hypothetical protein DXT98_27305 [Agrobacterium sp. ICMP 7243]MCJ9722169.1 hypothetical protein [Agrobacterium sp. BETTINA12B]MCJ9759003.1 hypothetical protein [Agrobacterium sp. SHOUNA12C]OCJ20301.1 hypothetical protein A6U88_31910 [Agrobacterium sp. B131/95]EJK83712.1 hypothetical protein PMI03_03058 [Rhizobium sp. AP16]